MASISKMQTTKDGRKYWRIYVSRGYGQNPYTARFYWPEGKNGLPISEKVALRDRDKFVRQFEQDCADGKVLNRKEKKAEEEEKRKLAEEERAKLEALKTVRQYGDGVFMAAKLQSISENTRVSYKTNLEKHVYPVIGDQLLKDITPAMITKLLLDFQTSHSFGSTIKLYNVLNGLFDMAQFDDSVPLSPMVKVKRPKQRKDDKAIAEADKALDADELNHVLECVAREPLKWQAFLYMAADTGCRRGELVGIQWADISWTKKTVTIRHNIQYSKEKGVYDVTPKGGRFRVVDLGDDTIEVLRAYRAELTKPDELETDTVIDINEYRKKLEEERKRKENALPKWIFTIDGSDQPMFPTSPTRFFKTFGETYNVPGFHPHMLRHTSASLSLTNGGDVKSIADRLGHKDASVTLRMYAHASDESIRAAGQAARNALKKKKEEQTKKENAGA